MSARPVPPQRAASLAPGPRLPATGRNESRTPVLLGSIGLLAGCALIASFLATLPQPGTIAEEPSASPQAATIREETYVPVGWIPEEIPAWPVPSANVPLEKGPGLRARSWYVVADESGEVLAAKDADVAVPIASITKLMGALVVADAGIVDDREIEITGTDQRWIQVTRSHFRVGTRCRAKDLLVASLVSSDNRATAALMRATGLRPEEFAARMNAKAQALGMRTAHFVEPTGLAPENVASPRDVAILLEAASLHPLVGPLLAQEEHRFERLDRDAEMVARSSNAFTRNPTWDVIAAKTGYTDEALSCLAIKTRLVDGRKVTMALLGAPGGIGGRYAAASRARVWLEGGPRPEEVALAKAQRAKQKAAQAKIAKRGRAGKRPKAVVSASARGSAKGKNAARAKHKEPPAKNRTGRSLSAGGR